MTRMLQAWIIKACGARVLVETTVLPRNAPRLAGARPYLREASDQAGLPHTSVAN